MRICNRCGHRVLREKEKSLKQYPWYCPYCDENLFDIETHESRKPTVTVAAVREMLKQSLPSEYAKPIAEDIIEDVRADVRAAADENFNMSDVRLAIGRVICDHMHLAY